MSFSLPSDLPQPALTCCWLIYRSKWALLKIQKISWVWWRMPVIPATQEAEAWESLEPRRQGLHSSRGDTVRLHLNNNYKTLYKWWSLKTLTHSITICSNKATAIHSKRIESRNSESHLHNCAHSSTIHKSQKAKSTDRSTIRWKVNTVWSICTAEDSDLRRKGGWMR